MAFSIGMTTLVPKSTECYWDVNLILCWHDGRLMHGLNAHARFNDFDLDARSQWVGKCKNYLEN